MAFTPASAHVSATCWEARADLCRIVVEEQRNVKAAVLEAGIARDGVPQIAAPHERDIPLAIHFENALDLLLQVTDAVAGTRLAELAEVGQILADLRRRYAQ